MECPKCGHDQPGTVECQACGIIFAKYRQRPSRPAPTREENLERSVHLLLSDQEQLFIQQNPIHWWEILINWEQANQYFIKDSSRGQVGFIYEESHGFVNALIRIFLGSHRPLDIKVYIQRSDDIALELSRDFFFLFSDMAVVTPDGVRLGSVHRRFGLIYKRYDLRDERGNVFATIKSPIWRLWTFPILDQTGNEVAVIAKKWSGFAQEYLTDADNFMLDFGKKNWSLPQKAVIFAAALSIDFDFFENNHQR